MESFFFCNEGTTRFEKSPSECYGSVACFEGGGEMADEPLSLAQRDLSIDGWIGLTETGWTDRRDYRYIGVELLMLKKLRKPLHSRIALRITLHGL